VTFYYNNRQKSVSNNPAGPEILIHVNGAPTAVPEGLNVRTLLAALRLDPARVAVELNRQIVRKPEWESTAIQAGASLEIVTFVGGGWN
jgi:thiamine biosynthesis protein ThiS